MKLNTPERLMLYEVLPRQGDVTSLKIVRDLQNELTFSQEEHDILSLVVDPKTSQITWNVKADFEKEIPLCNVAVKIIYDSLVELNRKKMLSIHYLDLYDKFMKEQEARDKEKK